VPTLKALLLKVKPQCAKEKVRGERTNNRIRTAGQRWADCEIFQSESSPDPKFQLKQARKQATSKSSKKPQLHKKK